MSSIDDATRAKRDAANRSNYASDQNLAKRFRLLEYAQPPQRRQVTLTDLFDWSAAAHVLDIGCGTGLWTRVAADRTPQGQVVGLDLSLGMLATLRSSAPSVAPVGADGHSLPFADDSFDVALSTWSLYHLLDKPRVLSDIVRVLRSEGRFIAATNSATSIDVLDEIFEDAISGAMERPVTRWIEPFDFTLESGGDVLAPYFRDVTRHINVTDYVVPDIEVVIGYAESLQDPITAETGCTSAQFDRFVDLVATHCRRRLENGPLRFQRSVAFFVASNA